MTLGLQPLPGISLDGDLFELQCAIVTMIDHNAAYVTRSLMGLHLTFPVCWSQQARSWTLSKCVIVNADQTILELPRSTELVNPALNAALTRARVPHGRAHVETLTFGVWDFVANPAA